MSASRPIAVCLLIALLAAWIHASPEARADSGEQCWCNPDSNHPNEPVSCDSTCYCNDSCGGGGGGAGGGGAGAAGLVKLVGAVFIAVAFFVVPARTLELIGDIDKTPAGTYAQKWKAVKDELAELARIGRAAASAAAALRRAEAAAPPDAVPEPSAPESALVSDELAASRLEELRDAPALKPFPRVALKPSRDFECHRALLYLPYTDGFGTFGSLAELDQACGPAPAPISAAGGTLCAPSTLDPSGQVCCHQDQPIFNACDGMCYATSDFRGSPTGAFRCRSFVDTRVSSP